MKTTQTITLLAAAAALTLGQAYSADAEVLVYEGFDYATPGTDQVTTFADPNYNLLHAQGDGPGDNLGTGLTGTYTDSSGPGSSTDMFLKSGSLSFSDLATSGNHVGGDTNSNSDINAIGLTAGATTGIAGSGTFYISFLYERLQNNFGADHEGVLLADRSAPQARWDSGNAGASGFDGIAVASVEGGDKLNLVAYDGTAGTRIVSDGITGTGVGSGVHMVVVEVSLNSGTAGADVLSLYSVADDGSLDAGDLGLAIDTIEANIDESTLTTLSFTRQVNVNYDEYRITTTLDEALGVPEPGSLALLGLGGLLIGARRRRA